ncbi:hypothetical protein [Streptomyces hoynatensis]|uniref:hypothetical protein n=1 Tax=Streptomyces hoynatensis TaxID=1141874 RepID=UPI001F4D806B|nr:hypothetical protein [Streptomyces hoynatensis]
MFHIRPETAHFVDREDEQERALRAVAEWGGGASRPVTLAVSGLGGVGKTELAFRIARLLRERYAPDAVLYVDLDEARRDGAVEVADVLGELLRDLDVAPEWLERSFAARRRQYWARTADRRLVLIVDNARFGSELLPLLPASGDSVVIVAGQAPLHDLAEGEAVRIPLGPLAERDGTALLRGLVDDPRLAAEPEAVAELVRLCSGLPAALHVAAARMRRQRRRPLSRLLEGWTADLDEEGLPVVEKVWDAAYGELGPDAALLYRLLADVPADGCPAEAVVALLGRGPEAAEEALEDLEAVGLLGGGAGERVRLPELLRAHARRRARRDGAPAERAAGVRRMVRWYLRQAQRADAAAAGPRLTLAAPAGPVPDAPDVPLPEAGERDAAREGYGWLARERHALHACVRLACEAELDAEAWALCEPLWTHFVAFPQHAAAVESFGLGVRAAQRLGDVRALARLRCQLARPLWELERFDEAEAELRQALGAVSALGEAARDRRLAASVVEFGGMLAGARGDWSAAAREFERSREMHRAIGNAYGEMLQTYRLGEALTRRGEYDRAAALLRQAHEAAGALGRARMTARTGFALGHALRGLGRREEAAARYLAALESARLRGSEHEEARVLAALAALAEESGDAAAAAAHRRAADAIRERNGGLA